MACFVVTGGAGFIGSNLARALIERGHAVHVVDDFSTGRRENLANILDRIVLFEGSICDRALLDRACDGADYCCHQAAIASVPYSIEHPVETDRVNIEGTLNVFLAARDAGLKRVVFASSSAVYGDTETLPVTEALPLAPISPYGVHKAANELYAHALSELYGIDLVGLRYFNVFGPRQNPKSQYAAVVPIFVTRMLAGEPACVDGDGLQSRDFSHVDNIVLANIQACEAAGRIAGVYNIACGQSCSILDLVGMINGVLGTDIAPIHRPARAGDIRHSWADISRAREAFGYTPPVGVAEGLETTVAWYKQKEQAV